MLGKQKLSFQKVVLFARLLPVRLRLIIVDSCFSGNVIRSKGGKRQRSIRWRLPNWSQSVKGLAILASSGVNEQSYESDVLRGSFFTANLLTGLRGAADRNQDQRVSLSEIRQYVYVQTLSYSVKHRTGLQRPAHHVQLQGQGPLFLTYLYRAQAQLFLPKSLQGQCFVFRGGKLLYEFQKQSSKAIQVGLPSGEYLLQVRHKGWVGSYEVQIKPQEKHKMSASAVTWKRILVEQPIKGSLATDFSTGVGLLIHYSPLSNLALHGVGATVVLDVRRWLRLDLRYQFGAANLGQYEHQTHDVGLRIAPGYGFRWKELWVWIDGFVEPRLTMRQTSRTWLFNFGVALGMCVSLDYHLHSSWAIRLRISGGTHVVLFDQQSRWSPLIETAFGIVWRL